MSSKRGVQPLSVALPANGTARRAIPETKPKPTGIKNRVVRQASLWI